MERNYKFIFIAMWLAISAHAGPLPELKLADTDRILVLAPHPDDEVLGCGGIIQEAVARKLPLRVVFLTHGDENQWSFFLYRMHPVIWPSSVRALGEVRVKEALMAARVFGLSWEHLQFLGYPDFGTLAIWNQHWGDQPAYKSLLTRSVAVPYSDALRPGAPHRGEEILRDLTQVLEEFRPTKVFVSHPADHNGDHRALYLFTRVALWDVEKEIQPTLHPYLIHYRRWPQPRSYEADAPLNPPATLDGEAAWHVFPLTPAQVATKHRALQEHVTQYKSNGRYLRTFIRTNELFGDWPVAHLTGSTNSLHSLELLEQKGPAEQLTEAERAQFTGVEWDHARLVGDNLELSLRLSRPLAREVQASIYAFGYRRDTPFAQMPKLHIKLGELRTQIFDQNRRLDDNMLRVTRSENEIIVSIPRAVLGKPDRILTGARTYVVEVPLDWVAWRVLRLD